MDRAGGLGGNDLGKRKRATCDVDHFLPLTSGFPDLSDTERLAYITLNDCTPNNNENIKDYCLHEKQIYCVHNESIRPLQNAMTTYKHILGSFLSLIELQQVIDIVLATEENRASLMDSLGLNIKYPTPTGCGDSTSLFRKERHRERLVQ